ncbi:alpha/beta fold hydrolase [Sutcliffiella sp. NPDC057660]|uniref:alpha/beta fold hydrolase n=1 Tax=Sutcliffiella sp. NPDC057660 TaxID=3346199 RepID=UPI0036BE5E70
MPYATTRDNVDIYYRLIGSGSLTLVFIHPPGMGHITFTQQLSLAKRYRLLLLDLRGNGKSGSNQKKIHFPLLAQDIYDVCQQLELNRLILIGYSNGASIAMEFAITYPSLAKGLILVGAFPKVNSSLLFGEFLLGILAAKLHAVPLLAKVIGNAHAYTKEFGMELETYINKTDANILSQMYQEGMRYDCTTRIADIKAPILLVYGQRDYYVHHYQNEFKSFHPETQVIYIGKAKHQVPTKFPDEFNAVVHSFIRKITIP